MRSSSLETAWPSCGRLFRERAGPRQRRPSYARLPPPYPQCRGPRVAYSLPILRRARESTEGFLQAGATCGQEPCSPSLDE